MPEALTPLWNQWLVPLGRIGVRGHGLLHLYSGFIDSAFPE